MSSKRKSPPSKLQEGTPQYNSTIVDNNNSGDKIKNYIKEEEEETDEQESEGNFKLEECLRKGKVSIFRIRMQSGQVNKMIIP